MSIGTIYLDSIQKRFLTHKAMGDKTLSRLSEKQLHWQPEGEPNSIAMIVKHLHGNMLSRWTDFLTSDGEKPGRHRDAEFEDNTLSKEQLTALWDAGWKCLLDTLASLSEADLEKTIYIRQEPHSVIDAINRQLAHIPYHVGQMVWIGKALLGDQWESLSIPKGKSDDFNKTMYGKR